MKNYYDILELNSDVSQERIREQYRLLLHAWHPDKFPTQEQKRKAEEKIKEINEAYEVLGDPDKRKQYDYKINNPNPVNQEKKSPVDRETPENKTYDREVDICQSCGQLAEVRQVKLYQNIGLLFRRLTKHVEGHLCKACINYYFWQFTGKTMLFGWWGLISFFVTPLIFFNNLFHFLSTREMKYPPINITPSPSRFWIISTILGPVIAGYIIITSFFPLSPQDNSTRLILQTPQRSVVLPTQTTFKMITPSIWAPTQSPSDTPVPQKVTQTLRSPSTPTPVIGCIHVSKLTEDMIGDEICVFGDVIEITTTDSGVTYINLENESFYILSQFNYPELRIGECVAVEYELLGYIIFNYNKRGNYHMIAKDIYHCNPWMEE